MFGRLRSRAFVLRQYAPARPVSLGLTRGCNRATEPAAFHRHWSSSAMGTRSFPALFVRGGTSNGLVIHRKDLPPQDQWHEIMPAAMGSPDSYGRQLNGMGGGISSTSKICVISPSDRPDADVDFTFVQVGVKDGTLDLAGNCGNMSSAVGPVAVNEGLTRGNLVEQAPTGDTPDYQETVVRVFNTNTSKIILSRFRVAGDPPRYVPTGDYDMHGVSGTQSRITLSFLDPEGAKTGKALPTGSPVNLIKLEDGFQIEASLVDVSNPGVFVRLGDLGLEEDYMQKLSPDLIESNTALKQRLEAIRQTGASMMGLDPLVESVPKILMLSTPPDSADVDIRCLAMSMGQAHKAVPLTLALCLGASASMPGTIASQLRRGGQDVKGDSVVIGHPSGTVEIGSTIRNGRIASADLLRTARVLMKGDVYY